MLAAVLAVFLTNGSLLTLCLPFHGCSFDIFVIAIDLYDRHNTLISPQKIYPFEIGNKQLTFPFKISVRDCLRCVELSACGLDPDPIAGPVPLKTAALVKPTKTTASP